jgi:TetR/AcrR family fatty acid metabolism transcriptional regulator
MTVHSAADRGSGDKRDRILTAAERIFARHWFFAAKVSDVAKEAGVADGTIYLYFKSKDDLLISLFERRMEQLNKILRAAIADKSPRDQLHTFIRTYLQLVADEPSAAEVLTIELRQSSKFMKEYDNPEFAAFLRILGGVIAAAQDDGTFATAIPPNIAARMIFGVLDELALVWVLGRTPSIGGGTPGTRPKKFDIVRAADWIITLVTTGLEHPKEPA